MTGGSPTSRLLEVSPIRDIVMPGLKSALDIRGLAKLFDNGGGQGLLDYRCDPTRLAPSVPLCTQRASEPSRTHVGRPTYLRTTLRPDESFRRR